MSEVRLGLEDVFGYSDDKPFNIVEPNHCVYDEGDVSIYADIMAAVDYEKLGLEDENGWHGDDYGDIKEAELIIGKITVDAGRYHQVQPNEFERIRAVLMNQFQFEA